MPTFLKGLYTEVFRNINIAKVIKKVYENEHFIINSEHISYFFITPIFFNRLILKKVFPLA